MMVIVFEIPLFIAFSGIEFCQLHSLTIKNFLEICIMNETMKEHWDHIYQTRDTGKVSWKQEMPKTSLDFIHSFGLSNKFGKTAFIIRKAKKILRPVNTILNHFLVLILSFLYFSLKLL
jgi:hypothetical protein